MWVQNVVNFDQISKINLMFFPWNFMPMSETALPG